MEPYCTVSSKTTETPLSKTRTVGHLLPKLMPGHKVPITQLGTGKVSCLREHQLGITGWNPFDYQANALST